VFINKVLQGCIIIYVVIDLGSWRRSYKEGGVVTRAFDYAVSVRSDRPSYLVARSSTDLIITAASAPAAKAASSVTGLELLEISKDKQASSAIGIPIHNCGIKPRSKILSGLKPHSSFSSDHKFNTYYTQ